MKIYIWNEDEGLLPKGFNEVEAEKVTIPGYEEFEFYTTKAIEVWNEGQINITEGKTGRKVAGGCNTKQAIAATLMALDKWGKTKTQKAIMNLVKENGISPLYKTDWNN